VKRIDLLGVRVISVEHHRDIHLSILAYSVRFELSPLAACLDELRGSFESELSIGSTSVSGVTMAAAGGM